MEFFEDSFKLLTLMKLQPMHHFYLVFILLLSTSNVHGAFPQNSLLNQERKQQRIQDTTERTGEQLDSLIDEFNRNGLAGSDLDVIKAIRMVLGNLSKEQMNEIVGLLNGAREDTLKEKNSASASAKVLTAYAGQKGVIVQLRRILLEYQSQVALFDLARLVKELGNRQTTNLHEAITLASSGFVPGSPSTSEQISIQLQYTEQEALAGEVQTILKRLSDISEMTKGSPDQRPNRATKHATESRLKENILKAVDEIKGKRLMSAVSFEKTSRDSLWEMAKILEPEKGELEQMVEALEKLENIIDKESQIKEDTEKLSEEDQSKLDKKKFPEHIQRRIEQLEKGLKFREFERDERMEELTKMEKIEQNALNSQQKILEDQIEKATNSLAERLDEAKNENKNGLIRTLENQLKQKEQQLKRAEQNKERRTKQLAAELERENKVLNSRVVDAKKRLEQVFEQASKQYIENKLNTEAEKKSLELAKEQGELADLTNFLANELSEVAPSISEAIKQSTPEMQEARDALKANSPINDRRENALPKETAALEKLDEARNALIEKISESEAIAEVPSEKIKALEDLLENVKEIKEKEEELQASTKEAENNNNTEELQEKSADQAELEGKTAEATSSASEQELPEAAAALTEAMAAMAEAGADLAAGENSPEAQQKAIDKLSDAEQAISEKLDELKESAQELANLNELIEKLEPIIEDQKNLNESTADSIPQDGEAQNNSEESKELASSQKDLQEQTSELANEASSASEKAANELADASTKQESASNELSSGEPASAAPEQSAALNDLNEAKAALEERASELAEALGEETTNHRRSKKPERKHSRFNTTGR